MTIRNNVGDKIAILDVTLDESIYPREKIDHKRVHIFSEIEIKIQIGMGKIV